MNHYCFGSYIKETGMFIFRIVGVSIVSTVVLAAASGADAKDAIPVREHGVALQRLEAQALAFHPSVLAAQDTLEAVSHEADAARWQFFPTPSLSAKANDSDASLTVGLSQPIYSGGRLTAQRDQAFAGRRAAQHSLSESRLALSLEVIAAYGALVEQRMVEDVYHAGLGDLAALRAVIGKRVEARISARSDALLTEARYTAVEDSFDQARTHLDGEYKRLSNLVGEVVTAADLGNGFASGVAAPPLPVTQKAIVAHALVAHPHIRRLRAERDAARSAVALAKSAWTPRISVQGEYERHSREKRRDDRRIELVFATDFSAGLSDRSRFLAAEAAQKAASHALSTAERQLRQELTRLFADYRVLHDSADRLSENVARLEDLLATYRRAFLLGRRSWVDVLNMLREKIQTRAELARTRARLFVVRQNLKRYEKVGDDDA